MATFGLDPHNPSYAKILEEADEDGNGEVCTFSDRFATDFRPFFGCCSTDVRLRLVYFDAKQITCDEFLAAFEGEDAIDAGDFH